VTERNEAVEREARSVLERDQAVARVKAEHEQALDGALDVRRPRCLTG